MKGTFMEKMKSWLLTLSIGIFSSFITMKQEEGWDVLKDNKPTAWLTDIIAVCKLEYLIMKPDNKLIHIWLLVYLILYV